MRLIFLEFVDKERQKFEKLRRKFSGEAGEKVESRREKSLIAQFSHNPAFNKQNTGLGCQTAWKNGQGIRENSVENCPP